MASSCRCRSIICASACAFACVGDPGCGLMRLILHMTRVQIPSRFRVCESIPQHQFLHCDSACGKTSLPSRQATMNVTDS
jgi:hypothetical protein